MKILNLILLIIYTASVRCLLEKEIGKFKRNLTLEERFRPLEPISTGLFFAAVGAGAAAGILQSLFKKGF